ncbi:MAG: 7-cyano-7-deazaguanine synthase [Euryarchaeota archaeon]|nr:7-cyano-7-deazaguanine synthase [Euryarchaeota archaeon]
MAIEFADAQMDGNTMIRSVMSLSGGMDSTSLLLRLLAEGSEITCISYDYGQKHSIELVRAKDNLLYLSGMGYDIDHSVINLKSAMSTLFSALTDEDIDIPEGHYESEQMKQTVVPNRNSIFASILYAHALSISISEDCDVRISLGVHSGDHVIYPDCRPEFYESLEKSFSLGNWGSGRISFHLPYISGDKTSILQDAIISCEKLGLNFDTVLGNTNTSYNPDEDGRSSGKSGADVERILAFHKIGRQDPIEYVDDWETILEYALSQTYGGELIE